MPRRRVFLGLLIAVSLLAVSALIAAPPPVEEEPLVEEPEEGAEPAAAAEEAEEDDAGADGAKRGWDVEAPPGESDEVPIDVTAGTWMSVDASPDGREIVFDLLGDLYLLPMAGGEARSLTRSVAWEMQPRFSPDGRSIAYTSDAGGGDNLWVMAADGTSPRPVTKEDFRLLNSPAWTPDGEFLAARKHFTSHRSLGAGEIWLYHRSGGEGLQVTERPNDQKDLGEPAFSPDGRYLYFSQDTTPGEVFEYNKDPNAQIYVIQRLDRQRGEIETLVDGPGGAVRPTPSPDGRALAFLRRVRGATVLFLKDLESGAEWPLWDGLDRDMQETWAVHGVYPGMSWTPDSRALVFWAGGKIRRLEVTTREVREIPFRVRGSRRVWPALRFPQEVSPERFPVRMLRWVQVSPTGDQVVYQALGHLWLRPLPEGEPRRLTRQTGHFEFYPSFSRDGRWIAYTTWNDEELGSLRVAPARPGGEGRPLTRTPGHYVEPVFTPDGSRIVFQRVAGGDLTSPRWSTATGLYWVPVAGGEPVEIPVDGAGAHFGAVSDRLFFIAPEGDDRRVLKSIELDGSDERAHLQMDNATELVVSPDERWVAFRHGFNAFVSPFVATGRPVELGPESKALPVTRVSRDAGEYLHWSGDSRRLHWALGPELFTRELTELFAFLPGASEKLPEPPASGRAIGFMATTDVPDGAVAMVGARLLTMRGGDDPARPDVVEDGTLVVEGNRILAVGRRSEVAVPAGAHLIDASGMTIMPGLIDVHAHGAQAENGFTPERNWVNAASLAYGVTTTHDPANDTADIFAASEMARAGLLTAPRIFSTGTVLYGAAGDVKAEIDSLDSARSHLRRMKAMGAFSVKSYNQPRRDQRQQVIAAARELEMMVVPEGGSLYQHDMTMIVDGHTGIEHSIPLGTLYEDVLELWSATATGYTPTLVVGYGGLWGENYWYHHTRVWEDERLLTFVPRRRIDARSRRRVMAPDEEYGHFANARAAAELLDAGVPVQLGAHGQREGLGAHWELWMFVQGGMSPLEALRAGTAAGAWYLGLDADLGSLAPGKLADLIVLDEDPSRDIRSSTSVHYTMVNGRLYDARTMDEVGNHPRPRGSFWWELPPPGVEGSR